MCACYEVEEETNETPHLHAPALYASRGLPRDKKTRDETAVRLFCNAFRGWSSKKEIFNAKPSNQPSQSITLLPIHFLIAGSNFPLIHLESEDCIWARHMYSRLYRLNSTFYNETKGINRNAIRYDSKCIAMQGALMRLLQRATSRTKLTSRTCEPAKSSRTGIRSRSSLS